MFSLFAFLALSLLILSLFAFFLAPCLLIFSLFAFFWRFFFLTLVAQADYQRMVSQEQEALAALNRDLALWNEADGNVHLWLQLSAAVLRVIDAKVQDRMGNPEKKEGMEDVKAVLEVPAAVPAVPPVCAPSGETVLGSSSEAPIASISPRANAPVVVVVGGSAKSLARPKAPPPTLPPTSESMESPQTQRKVTDGLVVKKIIRKKKPEQEEKKE
jgi:hypothetical protein